MSLVTSTCKEHPCDYFKSRVLYFLSSPAERIFVKFCWGLSLKPVEEIIWIKPYENIGHKNVMVISH